MTASDLATAVRPVVEVLEALGVTFYLTGSVASSAHGIARASLDADIVADLEPAHVEPLIDRLGSAYYIPVDRLHDAVRGETRATSSTSRPHSRSICSCHAGVPSTARFAARARLDAIDGAPGALRVPIASAEDTVLAKLEWFRRGGETSERQWWDIVGVLRVTPAVDRSYPRRGAAALGVSDLLERALAAADS